MRMLGSNGDNRLRAIHPILLVSMFFLAVKGEGTYSFPTAQPAHRVVCDLLLLLPPCRAVGHISPSDLECQQQLCVCVCHLLFCSCCLNAA
jgi:hypothetical protein